MFCDETAPCEILNIVAHELRSVCKKCMYRAKVGHFKFAQHLFAFFFPAL